MLNVQNLTTVVLVLDRGALRTGNQEAERQGEQSTRAERREDSEQLEMRPGEDGKNTKTRYCSKLWKNMGLGDGTVSQSGFLGEMGGKYA